MLFDAVCLVAVAAVVWAWFRFNSKHPNGRLDYTMNEVAPVKTAKGDYDVIVVGASIAGCMAAKRFSDQGRKVLLLDRTMVRPDRIIGELMQPGGMEALRACGMEECATSIGMTCTGYVAFNEGQKVELPFAPGIFGVSFHFGDFVQNLRYFVWKNLTQKGGNVTMLEANATKLLFDDKERVIGIAYTPTGGQFVPQGVDPKTLPSVTVPLVETEAKAPLTVLCDGFGSLFRRKIARNGDQDFTTIHSGFVGIILPLPLGGMPVESKGHVFLGRTGPFLAYRLDKNEVRMLIDYGGPRLEHGKLPAMDVIQKWVREEVKPQLPETLHAAFDKAMSNEKNIHAMGWSQYQMLFQRHKGVVGVGDHVNQRHPLTGGGMTCAFRDVLVLTQELSALPTFDDFDAQHNAIRTYMSHRCEAVSCINILSWSLFAVFSGPPALRRACFHYFFLGGNSVKGPMSLLSGINSSVNTLVYHYLRVVFYGCFLLMVYDPNSSVLESSFPEKLLNFVVFWFSPWRLGSAMYLLAYSAYVFAPLFKNEFLLKYRFVDPTC